MTSESEWIFSTQTSKGRQRITIPFDSRLFGITASYKMALHKELFDFVYASEGRFSHTELYHMPITLRRLNLGFLSDVLHKQQEAQKRRR